VLQNQVVTKYRKGACENCGATTHTMKFCVERPRKLGAKYSGRDFKQDEIIEEVALDYEGKRDRWNGYDPDAYKRVIEDYESLNEEAKKQRQLKLEEKMRQKAEARARGEEVESDTDSDDEDGDREEEVTPFEKQDPRIKTTIRNLRIREDTAKYLRNLDPTSA